LNLSHLLSFKKHNAENTKEENEKNIIKLLSPFLTENNIKLIPHAAGPLAECTGVSKSAFGSKKLMALKGKFALNDDNSTVPQIIAAFQNCIDILNADDFLKFSNDSRITPSVRLLNIVLPGIARGGKELEPSQERLELLSSLELPGNEFGGFYREAMTVIETGMAKTISQDFLKPPCEFFNAICFFAAHAAPLLSLANVITATVPEEYIDLYHSIYTEVFRCLFTSALSCETNSALKRSRLTKWIPSDPSAAFEEIKKVTDTVRVGTELLTTSKAKTQSLITLRLSLSFRPDLDEFMEKIESSFPDDKNVVALRKRLMSAEESNMKEKEETSQLKKPKNYDEDDDDDWNW
jgi:hypothetical protein